MNSAFLYKQMITCMNECVLSKAFHCLIGVSALSMEYKGNYNNYLLPLIRARS